MGRSTPPAHSKADAGVSHGRGAIKEISWQGEIFTDAESKDLWEEMGFQLNLKYQICPWSFSFHLCDSEGWVGQASLSIESLRLTPLSTAPLEPTVSQSMKRISWKENQTLWQELRTALSPNCLRLDCRQGSPVLPWVGTGRRRVPGAMTDKKLRGGLPNKQRPLSPQRVPRPSPQTLRGHVHARREKSRSPYEKRWQVRDCWLGREPGNSWAHGPQPLHVEPVELHVLGPARGF